MATCYSHLNRTERTLIKDWKKQNLSLREIGRRLNRSHSTISRELRRNLWFGRHYYIRSAQEFYEYRLKRRAQRYRLKTQSIRDFVHQKLNIGWTPELISGRLREMRPNDYVCHESIYQYIYLEASHLIECLARKHKKRRTKHPYRGTVERIKNRVPIALRPIEVDGVKQWDTGKAIVLLVVTEALD